MPAQPSDRVSPWILSETRWLLTRSHLPGDTFCPVAAPHPSAVVVTTARLCCCLVACRVSTGGLQCVCLWRGGFEHHAAFLQAEFQLRPDSQPFHHQADAVKKKKKNNPNPSFLQNFCSIIRCWTPASESSCKYFSFFQSRWVMSALGTECTGNTFPFRGTCLRQSSQEKVGQYLAFFLNKYTHFQSFIWAQGQVSLAFSRLRHPAHVPARDRGK